jgi:transcriptional regulator with XRE-family HTH domain
VSATPTTLDESLATSLRAARARTGWTLDQVAAESGLSKAYLSRLESGERRPSLATLFDLARTFGVPVSTLLGESLGGVPLAIHGAEQSHSVNGLTVTPISGFSGSRAIDAVRLLIPVDRCESAPASHEGEEWVYVLAGTLRLEFDAAEHILRAGQVAHFDATRPHRLGASAGDAEVLLVAADPPHEVRRLHRF